MSAQVKSLADLDKRCSPVLVTADAEMEWLAIAHGRKMKMPFIPSVTQSCLALKLSGLIASVVLPAQNFCAPHSATF